MIADTYKAACRVAHALDPESVKIDGRDNRDRIAFVSAYSKLIIYYNQKNQPDGNWQPFFMKDPAVLLAAISKTDYEGYHTRFMLAEEVVKRSPVSESEQINYVNNVCQLLKEIFSTINEWFMFMELGASGSSLQLFLSKKIKKALSSQLSYMIALQQRLSNTTQGAVTPPDVLFYRSFPSIWHERSSPRLSSLVDAENANGTTPYVDGLHGIYHVVFDVFVQTIEHAAQAYYQRENLPTQYPDTALLKAFSQLMDVQQAEINKLGRKHLDFYYDDILCQSIRPAQPDHVFVCLKLADKVDAYHLPAGTLFKAGTYPDQSEILFYNKTQAKINRAAISSVYTLYYDQTSADDSGLYLKTIPAPDQITRNPLQEIVDWDGFGSNHGDQMQQGFAVASPMLFLQAGLRTITITFWFAKDAQQAGSNQKQNQNQNQKQHLRFLSSLQNNQFFLSTENGWFAVAAEPACGVEDDSLQLTISLSQTDPAIVAKHLDGLTSSWPMFKMVLGNSIDLTEPPILKKVAITVDVNGFNQLSMATDTATLANQGAQAILGAVSELGSRFYVGSNECFAKPLSSLTLTMNWDKLPADFEEYYTAYNKYLASPLAQTTPNKTAAQPPKHAQAPARTFTNLAFGGQWKILRLRDWQTLAVKVESGNSTQDENPEAKPAASPKKPSILKRAWQWIRKAIFSSHSQDGAPSEPPTEDSDGVATLFQQYSDNKKIRPNSIFTFVFHGDSNYKPAPELITNKLPTVTQANNGYIRFELNSPEQAFGAKLYPQVVSWVSLVNAQYLIDKASIIKIVVKAIFKILLPFFRGPAPKLEDMPNQPYIPKTSGVYADYVAISETGIASDNAKESPYPLEIYHYGSFKPYLAYEAIAPEKGPGILNLTPKTVDVNQDAALTLFPGVSGQGGLYVSLSGVSAPCTVTMYAEISAIENQIKPDGENIGYFYWSHKGWRPLTVLRDETFNLNHSGIIQIEIPREPPAHEVTTQSNENKLKTVTTSTPLISPMTYASSPIMPNGDFWLAIATKSAVATNMDKPERINFKVSYLNTQAVKLSRESMESLPLGEIPIITANAISATKNKTLQISSITQPYPSFGGRPAEDKSSYGGSNSFYRRVSARLNHKDRCVNTADFVAMAHAAYHNLYYARVLASGAGEVRIGLVNRYANAQSPSAFRPLVSSKDQDLIVKHIAARVSAHTRLSVYNLKHQVVTVSVTVIMASSANENAMRSTLNQLLKIYLSPWIDSEQLQANLDQRITPSALIRFVLSQDNVVSVTKLSLSSDSPQDDETLWVSDIQHDITLLAAEAP